MGLLALALEAVRRYTSGVRDVSGGGPGLTASSPTVGDRAPNEDASRSPPLPREPSWKTGTIVEDVSRTLDLEHTHVDARPLFMRIRVIRKWFSQQSTIGEMYTCENGLAQSPYFFECFTLEDRIRAPGVKVKGSTAIPDGIYTLAIDWSERFGRLMPHVLDVPGFVGIRIHPGNSNADTEGCLLVGAQRMTERVVSSKVAYDKLFPRIVEACKTGKVKIEYVNESVPLALLKT